MQYAKGWSGVGPIYPSVHPSMHLGMDLLISFLFFSRHLKALSLVLELQTQDTLVSCSLMAKSDM